MDEVVEFPIPGVLERQRLFDLYLKKYILAAGTDEGGAGAERRHGLMYRVKYAMAGRKVQVDPIQTEGLTDDDLVWAAELCEGFSAREIAKSMAAVQSAAYGTPNATLSRDLFRTVVEARKEEHLARVRMERGELNQV
jgi:ATPase family AAA domain-containing protein 3A/B